MKWKPSFYAILSGLLGVFVIFLALIQFYGQRLLNRKKVKVLCTYLRGYSQGAPLG